MTKQKLYYIYQITDKNNEEIFYIGSTNNFSSRKSRHKKNVKNKVGKLYWLKLYVYIRSNGGWENFEMKIIEEHSFENNKLIREIEKKIIDEKKPYLNTKI